MKGLELHDAGAGARSDVHAPGSVKIPGAHVGASIGATVGYAAAVLFQLRSFYYFPRLDTWGFETIASEPAVRWYGYLLYGVLGGLLGAVAGKMLLKSRASWHLVWLTSVLCLILLVGHEWSWFTR